MEDEEQRDPQPWRGIGLLLLLIGGASLFGWLVALLVLVIGR